MTQRYFIVFHASSKGESGFLSIWTDKGFPSWKELVKSIREKFGWSESVGVTITNILELSEEDYKAWIAKPPQNNEI